MDRWLAVVIVVLFTFVLSMRRKRLALERQQRRKVFEDDLRRRQRLKHNYLITAYFIVLLDEILYLCFALLPGFFIF